MANLQSNKEQNVVHSKRLIEDSLPLKILSEFATKERPANRKTLSALHQWWARRPLTLSRAIILSCILPAPLTENDRVEYHNLIKEVCSLEIGSPFNHNHFLKLLQKIDMIKGNHTLRLLDPFGGGGSIPFEGLRLGLDIYTGDLNPVSYLIRKAALELIPKFSHYSSSKISVEEKLSNPNVLAKKIFLVDTIKYWATYIKDQAYDRLSEYYERETITYFFLKTCICKSCNREIPLQSISWVSPKKKLGIFIKPNMKTGTFQAIIAHTEKKPPTLRDRTGLFCIFCQKKTMTTKDIRLQALERGLGTVALCKLIKDGDKSKKDRMYVPMSKEDIYRAQEAIIQPLNEYLYNDPQFIPIEPSPPKEALGNSVVLYGYQSFASFFSPRQQLTLGIFAKLIRELYPKLHEQNYSYDLVRVIMLVLAFVLDRFVMFNNLFTFWYQQGELIKSGMTVGQYRISWEYIEPNPFTGGSGSWDSCLKTTLDGVINCMLPYSPTYHDRIGSATKLPYNENFFDLIITDPPYYDYIGYADASDFFYVWLKRTIGQIFPEAFVTELTPKTDELILSNKPENSKDKLDNGLDRTWKECYRVLKSNGIIVIQFTNRSIEAWEQLFETLHNAGFYLVATWPILSESPSKLSAHRADVKTTLNIICRKRDLINNHLKGDYNSVKIELNTKISQRCQDFWIRDLLGSDFFIAALGTAIEVFSRYEKILQDNIVEISLKQFFLLAREDVINFVIDHFLGSSKYSIDKITHFYIIWRSIYLASSINIDDLSKLLKNLTISIDQLQKERRISIIKERVKVLDLWERSSVLLYSDPKSWSTKLPLIDQLHIACLLYEKGSTEQLDLFLTVINAKVFSHPIWTLLKVLIEILHPIQVSRPSRRFSEFEIYRRLMGIKQKYK